MKNTQNMKGKVIQIEIIIRTLCISNDQYKE